MNAHEEQIASYYDPKTRADVWELRCTVCNVRVEKVPRAQSAEGQQKIREAWQRHATPPAEGDYQI